MNAAMQNTIDKIGEYKKKLYKNQLIKGLLISTALLLGLFLLINFLEFIGRFGTYPRLILFVIYIAASAYTLAQFILKPLYYLFNTDNKLSNEEAAIQIGRYFPEIKDKLINTIQLAQVNSVDNSLLEASIAQRTEELKWIKFADAIQFRDNRKYLKFVLPPVAIALCIALALPKFYHSTERIVKFTKTFADPAPFTFYIENEKLQAYKHEDFTLHVKMQGETLPDEVFILAQGRRYKMLTEDGINYSHTFNHIQEPTPFHFEAAGYTSDSYKIDLVGRPQLLSFNVSLKYPAYLGKSPENFDNVGNLIIPEGTIVRWSFKTDAADKFEIVFDSSDVVNVDKGIFRDFNYQRKISKSTAYEIQLHNEHSENADPIHYFINVIPDRYPQITFEQMADTALYQYIGIGGTISDDYGITKLQLFYRNSNNPQFKSIQIPFNKSSLSQTFFYQLDLQELGLSRNDQLEYYLMVTDNDGVKGPKSTKTSTLRYLMPTDQEYSQDVENQVNKAENQFDELVKKSRDFKKDLNTIENELKKKKQLDFQDKKDLDRLLQKKEELNKEIQDLKNQLQELLEKQSRFEQQSPQLQQKMEMIQKMLNELMESKDSKVLEELKKMMEKSLDEKSLDQLEKFNKNQRNLDKELDRTLKLFQELQRKQKIEETSNELKELAEEQEKLSEADANPQDQEKINQKFEDIKKKLEDIENRSNELNKSFDPMDDKQSEISEDQKQAKKELSQQNKDAASKAQKNAAKKMKQMAEEMEQQMQSAEMQQAQVDLNAMREILENLIKVSHDQERIMKTFRTLSVSDPRFVQLSQEQLNIANDAKIIEDSLFTLASRVMQLEATVTKEVTAMKNHIDESVKLIRERKLPQASMRQQSSMTSMNNLALLLSDVFKQMQSQMATPGSGKGKQNGSSPGDFGKKQQMINQRMEGIGSEGKTQREISEEIAKLVNEQAKLRKELQEMQDKLNGTEVGKKLGDELKNLQKEMEKSEEDLVNKKITPELKRRQKLIETRLLEADKAIKEQELDPNRQAKTAQKIQRSTPPDLEKFKKEKEKQVELLRTTPPNYTPFYKNQTENYFKKIN
ncbi:hypothetical protein Lbys_2592 [Leadbetterella byssophila DSM 17132]|uniref:ATPase n=1 Tax=Leadbetterella byssophila (strain DSM 17132 / JCM 16389 / KACC 11308 / NBRC 106382 / 4M15) TaxID=649349 RepID=E4RZL1_LEAB4|nr:DUF4175 family protein [Leadbetterella byssophila]ADQ18254.1 hypothetical protein Lbys_2592 [Leadbetterella byssophila DSM 17132]